MTKSHAVDTSSLLQRNIRSDEMKVDEMCHKVKMGRNWKAPKPYIPDRPVMKKGKGKGGKGRKPC